MGRPSSRSSAEGLDMRDSKQPPLGMGWLSSDQEEWKKQRSSSGEGATSPEGCSLRGMHRGGRRRGKLPAKLQPSRQEQLSAFSGDDFNDFDY